MKKKKNEYIGWESSDGNLKIIEIIDGSVPVLCKVKCKICSQDNELFPEGYFIVNLHNITRGHIPLGFPNGYINSKSRFEYICPKHGKQNVRYSNFVINKRSCRYCGLERRREIGKTYGRYTNRSEEKDFLYILNFGEEYIKVGRSFNIKSRISSLKSESGISDIRVIAVYSSLHKNIYKIEQKIHDELRSNNYDYLSANWSTEIFKNECVELLYKIIGKYENEGALINESFLYL